MIRDFSSLKRALPYIKAFSGKTFIIKLGGEVCESSEVLTGVAEQIAILYFLGMNLVLVHGGGKQGTDLAKNLGVESTFVAGRRITSPEMLDVMKMAVRGKVNTDLVSSLIAQGVKAVGLSGVDGELISAKKRAPLTINGEEIDFGEIGDVTSVNPEVLATLMKDRFIPLVACLSVSPTGEVFNTNADTIATKLAISLKAEKIIFISAVDGIMGDLKDPSTLISQLNVEQASELLTGTMVSGGMIPKIECCISALDGGVKRAHILNGLQPNAVLTEIFTNEGCGTMIVGRGE